MGLKILINKVLYIFYFLNPYNNHVRQITMHSLKASVTKIMPNLYSQFKNSWIGDRSKAARKDIFHFSAVPRCICLRLLTVNLLPAYTAWLAGETYKDYHHHLACFSLYQVLCKRCWQLPLSLHFFLCCHCICQPLDTVKSCILS